MNVAENLYDYLKHNDKAELIGFGTFYVKSSSAQINSLTKTIEPPKRQILFSKEQANDMSFVKFMAMHDFIKEETALTWIKQYSDSLKEKIEAGRTYKIGRLGTLSKGSLGEYTFTADEGLNLMDDAFALGELKNIQTFDVNPMEDKVDLLHTKPEVKPEEKIEAGQDNAKELAIEKEKQEEIKKKIEEVQQLRDEEKLQESEPETTTRIIRHSEANVESEVEKPVSEQEIKDKLKMDATPEEDKTWQTIKKAEQEKKNVVVEDIIKQEPKKEDNASEQDELRKKAQEIIEKNKKDKELVEEKQPKKRRHHNGRKKGWLIVFWIIICLIILCAGFVAAHYFGLLKNVKFLKPVTDKLSYYIPVKADKKPEKTLQIKPVATPTETVEETMAENTEIPQTPYQAQEPTTPAPKPKKQAVKQVNNKKKNNKKQSQTTAPAPKPVVVDNTPVTTQNYSRLGFDVVGGSFSEKSKAENLSRKAKSLGYDSYVLSKIKSGSPIYYVSYGSRRTLREANDLMQSMMSKMGGSYYVISR